MFKFNLVDEWKSSWRWVQVQLGAILAIAPELYAQVGAMQAYVAPETFRRSMAVLGVLVMINAVRRKAR